MKHLKLKSYYGNEIVITNDKRKIEKLKDSGYTEVKEKTETKRVKKNENKEKT